MSTNVNQIQLENFIALKLFYTANVIHKTRSKSDITDNDGAVRLCIAISCFEYSEEAAWIAHKLIAMLRKSDDGVQRIQLNLIPLQKALHLIDKSVPNAVEQELLKLHDAVVTAKEDMSSDELSDELINLNETTLKFLKHNFQHHPALVHWIIDQLLCIWSPSFSITDIALQNIYIEAIKEIIEKTLVIESPADEDNYHHSLISSPKNINLIDNQHLAPLLCILSKFDITESKEKELTSWLWPTLFKVCKLNDVELALFARKDPKCYKMWIEYVDEINGRNKLAVNIDNALQISYAILEEKDEITKACSLNVHEIFTRMLKNRTHFLSDILGICYILTINSRLEDLEKILKTPEFDGLWLPLLFKCLENCLQIKRSSPSSSNDVRIRKNSTISSSSLRFILENCRFESMQDDPIIVKLKSTLKCHLDAWDWIVKSRLALEYKHQGSMSNQNVNSIQIFNYLQNYSVLNTIKLMVPNQIHNKSYNEIFPLLKDSDDSRITYQAYYAMLSTLKAILFCSSYDTHSETVREYYSDMIKYVNTLYPLSLRLDVLENIFSMMFLRHEYFTAEQNTCDNNDDDSHDSADDDDDNDDDGNLNNHSQYHSPSRKNSGQYQTGFICNKYAIRETLHYLKTCIFVADNECTRQKHNSQESEIHDVELIHERIASLKKYLTEATWRLELLTNADFISNQGIKSPNLNNKNDIFNDKSINLLNNKQLKYNFYKTDDSSSDTNDTDNLKQEVLDPLTSSESSMGNTTADENVKRRRRRVRSSKSHDYSSESKELKQVKEFTINYMLSSRDTLLLRCMWKDDYNEAQRVIKTFNMEKGYLAGEIAFSKALKTFKRKDIDMTTKQWPSNTEVPANEETNAHKKHSTVDFIRKAAEDGMLATRITRQVEQFLTTQEPNIALSTSSNIKDIMTLITVDLALTTGQDNQTSEDMSEIAIKNLRFSKKLHNSQFYKFFETIYQLFYEKRETTSIYNILRDARIPLNLKEYRDENEYWKMLDKKLMYFVNKAKLIDAINNDENEENVDNVKDEVKNKFNALLNFFNNGEIYFHKLNSHLDIIRTIAPTLNELKSLPQFVKPNLLENSIDYYIGYQIFDLNREIDSLEMTANKLKINLVYSILSNCCPKLLCNNNNNKQNQFKNTRWGIIVLNKMIDDEKTQAQNNGNLYDPNSLVIEILSELIQAFKEHQNLQETDLQILTKDPKIIKILNKTQCFMDCDLGNLSFGHQTLAFFINIWNLMMIHTILEVWSQDPPVNDLRHSVSCSTIGYLIGDLGFVTLNTLRTKLLGQSYKSLDNFVEYSEELNEPAWQDLDLQHDPRVIFAMINEYQQSPIIRIYNPETLNEDLKMSTHDYLSYYCNNDDKTKRLKLVEIYNDVMRSISSKEETIIRSQNDSPNDENSGDESLNYSYAIKLKYSEDKNFLKADNNKDDNEQNLLWNNREMKSHIIQYLEGHCWLLSYLVQKFHSSRDTNTLSNSDEKEINNSVDRRMAILENLFKSSYAQNLKCISSDNSILAGLKDNYIATTTELWHYFEILTQDKQYEKCLTILNSLPDTLLIADAEIQCFRDKILTRLIDNLDDNILIDDNSTKVLQYLYQIKDIYVLTKIILSRVKTWPARICEFAIRHVLNHEDSSNLPSHCRSELSEILCRVLVFDKMLMYCKLEDDDESSINSWYDVVYRTEKTDPTKIVKSLIDANQFELCSEWMEYQTTPSLELQSLVSEDLLIGLLKNEKNNFAYARKLLPALPTGLLIKLCKSVIDRLESVNALKFVIRYLLENSSSDVDRDKWKKTYLGVEILEKLDVKDRPCYIHLISEPLLMLEQLLMNCKFETLGKIMKNSSEQFKLANFSLDDFDAIVRFYAQKSLDFRGVTIQRDLTESINTYKSKDTSLNRSSEFIMPVNIPTREDWIPDDKVRECSCCKAVTFSMFNRRHHCRRCGRVVCGSCSSQKMRIPSNVHSILVRVCNDCKRQTEAQIQITGGGTPSVSSSDVFESWKLTTNNETNKLLRDEFCFEYAPNILLCLAILDLHSDNKTYATFLLDRCGELKDLLSPDNNGQVNPEVDHGLIIKIIKSLLIAAKFKCAELGLNTGLINCDEFLSHVDLIATLVKSGCLSLIPKERIDDHTLKKLRDSLTEKEQWRLALDVSTKCGLQTQGIWAAWGKACLKVGLYASAREKFSYCFDRVYQQDDWILLPQPPDKNDKNIELIKNRPSKDPPLLQEILQILQSSNFADQYSTLGQPNLSPFSTSSDAHMIMNTLKNLNGISHGQYTATFKPNPSIQSFRYQECLYYLLMYGSYTSILEFFVHYNELGKCLSYIFDNEIEPELFFNTVFMGCLKTGSMTKLFDEMKIKDASLLVWKKYLIYICHNLEKKQLLNTLYQVQLFMKDYVRAAMTCIRFYVMDASSYADICLRNHFLLDAQRHLEQELQQVESNIATSSRRRSTSTIDSSGSNRGLTMEMEPSDIDKHINTISRQMEIAKFLSNCEKEGRSVNEFLSTLSFMESEGLQPRNVPTLFGNQQERTHLAVLAILCGINVEEGFGIAFRVMQDYNLRVQKVYSLVGHILACNRKIHSIEQLINCCRSSGAANSIAISDRILVNCIKYLIEHSPSNQDNNTNAKDQIDRLIKLITDVELKIASYIESKQLKAAYLIAVKHSRAHDIRRILKEADNLGLYAIKSICTKWLQQNQHEST